MGSLSVCTHRGLLHWQSLLLVVSLLNFWSQPTTTHVTVGSINALEGTNVLLHNLNKPPNVAGLMWYRGYNTENNRIIASLTVNSGIHKRVLSDRPVMINYDGSLMLKNVTMKDSGVYTLLIQLQDCTTITRRTLLNVYPLLRAPTLLASNTTVTENKDAVVMTCQTDAHAIHWLFNGTPLQLRDRMKLSFDHKNLTIDPVQREDAGDYQCNVFNPMNSAKSAPITLDVKFQ